MTTPNELEAGMSGLQDVTTSMDEEDKQTQQTERILAAQEIQRDDDSTLQGSEPSLKCSDLRTLSTSDLDMEVKCLQEAADDAENVSDQARLRQNLGVYLLEKYLRSRSTQLLEKAVDAASKAAEITPVDSPRMCGRLVTYSCALWIQYCRSERLSDLDKAIVEAQKAVDQNSANSHPTAAFRNLGTFLAKRYRETGSIADSDNAIIAAEQAINSSSSSDPDWPALQTAYADFLSERYGRTEELADLNRALMAYELAIKATPVVNPSDKVKIQCYLAHTLFQKYQLTRSGGDLDKALAEATNAFDAMPATHPSRAAALWGIARARRAKYRLTESEADIREAIAKCRQALELTPPNGLDRPNLLYDLAACLNDLYYSTGARTWMEQSLVAKQQALAATPANAPQRAFLLNGLASSFRDRYTRTKAKEDLEESYRYQVEASQSESSDAQDRLVAYRVLLQLAAGKQRWSEAYEAARAAIDLIPDLFLRSSTHSDKLRALSRVLDLATESAAVAVEMGRISEAVQFLEQGRGILAGDVTNLRTDISKLWQQYPELAEKLQTLRSRLEGRAMLSSVDESPGLSSKGDHMLHHAGRELDELVARIRTQPGYDRFLRSPHESDIMNAANGGPIVVVNVSQYRCDALVIKPTQIQLIELPYLSKDGIFDGVEGQIEENLYPLRVELLEWLWDSIAQPILEAIGLTRRVVGDRWPRMWWIPTGGLCRMPLHAAGYHLRGNSETVLDRVVSSYSTSLRALLQSRQNSRITECARQAEKLVAIGMSDTLGHRRLHFAQDEVNRVRNICNSATIETSEPRPVKETVLKAMQDCTIFHFAGHGAVDATDPLRSQLLLQDWRHNPLSLADFLKTSLEERSPFLAYLSACGTGQVKDDGLIDESVHLVSGFQIAGFRHAIGTLWEVNDRTCVDMAAHTYEEILRCQMSDDSVSLGLHKGSTRLRDQWVSDISEQHNEPHRALGNDRDVEPCDDDDDDDADSRTRDRLLWVPYVHYGV